MEVDVIDWKLVGKCNLRCLHCYGPDKSEGALPEEDLLEMADTFAELGAQWVVLTGGEPLLVKGIDNVMERLTSHGMKIALSTNSMFFRDHQDTIERHVSSLNIPLDGSTPEVHALSRLDEASYHTFFDVLNHYLLQPELKPELLRAGTVYSAATQGDFINIARLLEPYSSVLDTWKIYELMDYEFQPEIRAPLMPDEDTFDAEMSMLLTSTSLGPKLDIARNKRRDKAYFMVNPQGLVVIPTDISGRTYELPLKNIRTDPLEEVVKEWQQYVQPHNYAQNHAHYTRKQPRERGQASHRLAQPTMH